MFRHCVKCLNPAYSAVLLGLKKKAHVRCAIDVSAKRVLSRNEFFVLCTTAAEGDEKMTQDEAQWYLSTLHEAGVVLESNDVVYLSPELAINEVFSQLNLPPMDVRHPEQILADDERTQRLAQQNALMAEAVGKSAKYRRRFWSVVGAASGAQMCTLAYLTFIEYDWDVMEPASYFLTSATALASYLYFIYTGREHSYAAVDENVLPSRLQTEVAASGVDMKKWISDLSTTSSQK